MKRLRSLHVSPNGSKNPEAPGDVPFMSSSTVTGWSDPLSHPYMKIVGYPNSYLSLRCLLSDEFSNIAFHIRKLVGTGHPLLKTAKKLVYNGKYNLQTRGLIVLLISKAAGHPNGSEAEQFHTAGITHSQRSLAEITEMIHIAQLIHKGVVNVSAAALPDGTSLHDMDFGNKIAILCGDYLLANACTGLAELRNNTVVQLIANSIRDFTEAEFMGEHDVQGASVPSANAATIDDWTARNFLATGSLMARSCQSALELAGHDRSMQEQAFTFGREIALAWQVHLELQPFVDLQRYPIGTPFDLTSAPVIFCLQDHDSLLAEILQHKHNLEKANYKKIHEAVHESDSVELSKKLCRKHAEAATKAVSGFEECDAKVALQNIASTMLD